VREGRDRKRVVVAGMRFNRSIGTPGTKKAQERRMREQAYDDGYAGRPAALSLLVYQQSYRRGQAAREADTT
jgi:hypothetical protein